MCTKTVKLMALACSLMPLPMVSPGEYPEAVKEALEGARQNIRTEQMQEILSRFFPQMYDQLFEAAKEYPAAVRFSLINDLLASYPGREERGRAGIGTRHIIRYLVGHLSDGEASFAGVALRNLASSELYHGVPDVHLRDFTQEILEAIRSCPDTRWAARLVGKLGCARARGLLKVPEVVEKMTPQEPVPKGEERNIAYEARRIERRNLMKVLDVEAALARLGDRDLEWKFIEGFRNRTKEDWWMWLQYLGYIGSPGCVVELARGFLQEPYHPNVGGGPPAWQRYAAAFHEALPYEPTFWFFPDYGGQKDYYRIRAWVKDYLGIEPPDEKPSARFVNMAVTLRTKPYSWTVKMGPKSRVANGVLYYLDGVVGYGAEHNRLWQFAFPEDHLPRQMCPRDFAFFVSQRRARIALAFTQMSDIRFFELDPSRPYSPIRQQPAVASLEGFRLSDPRSDPTWLGLPFIDGGRFMQPLSDAPPEVTGVSRLDDKWLVFVEIAGKVVAFARTDGEDNWVVVQAPVPPDAPGTRD